MERKHSLAKTVRDLLNIITSFVEQALGRKDSENSLYFENVHMYLSE